MTILIPTYSYFTNKTNDANILRKYYYFLRYSHQFLIPKLDEKASSLNHENISFRMTANGFVSLSKKNYKRQSVNM